ncbi:hypothetical protein AGMMS49949_06620 [Alphaproteobacteria bacterium]|nr:hypothetical protein AGMMS49949_06620 [Alphaproteobacteria bacterium]GHS98428.1 hypothetical protein AGMMS50296_6080 [Alphaproteobacteria bacterium]
MKKEAKYSASPEQYRKLQPLEKVRAIGEKLMELMKEQAEHLKKCFARNLEEYESEYEKNEETRMPERIKQAKKSKGTKEKPTVILV